MQNNVAFSNTPPKKEREKTDYEKFEEEFYKETLYLPSDYIRRQIGIGYTPEQIERWYDILCDLIQARYSGKLFPFSYIYALYEQEEEKKKAKESCDSEAQLHNYHSVFCCHIQT